MKKKIDDYIKRKPVAHEDEDIVREITFNSIKKISGKQMPVYSGSEEMETEHESSMEEE